MFSIFEICVCSFILYDKIVKLEEKCLEKGYVLNKNEVFSTIIKQVKYCCF